jgi:hypothetical protein
LNHRGDRRASETKTGRFIKPGRKDEVRPWFCRTCGIEEQGTEVPVGWYALTRKAAHRQPGVNTLLRLGLYCSADCLEGQTRRLKGIEHVNPMGTIAMRNRSEWPE